MDKPKGTPLAEFISKPASVLYEEFNQKLVDLVNLSGLPKFCLVPVLDDVLRQTRAAAENEYRHDFREWQNRLAPIKGEEAEDKTEDGNNVANDRTQMSAP